MISTAGGPLVPANGCPPIIGVSDALRRVVRLAEQFATSDLPILIVGQTGTGKELLAQHVHHWSGRCGPLIDVNCAGLPRDLADGWLFGHRRRAFTGAGDAAPGLIEAAEGGSLFLDEVCSLPVDAQPKLLRVLETKRVRRLMDVGTRPVSFRLISAAQEDLDDAVERGGFRRDLYQRLAGAVLRLPPLKERVPDILALAQHFAEGHQRELDTGALQVLREYPWPGNVRELGTAIGRAAILDTGRMITPGTLAEAIALGAPTRNRRNQPAMRKDATQMRAETMAALEASAWCKEEAARSLGIHRATLFRRMRSLGIEGPNLRT